MAAWAAFWATADTFPPDVKHIVSPERLPFSVAYFGSLGLTLFFAIGIRSTIGTLIAAIVQVGVASGSERPRKLTTPPPGRSPPHLPRGLLPWRRHDAALWWPDGPARRGQRPAFLIAHIYALYCRDCGE